MTCRQIRSERSIALSLSSDVFRAVALRRAKIKTRVSAGDFRLVLEFLISRTFEPLESCLLQKFDSESLIKQN